MGDRLQQNNLSDSSPLGRHLARFVGGRSGLQGTPRAQVEQQIAALAAALEGGDSCLVTERPPLPETLLVDAAAYGAGARAPLVYDDGRLYFYRYFHYENLLAARLCRMAEATEEAETGILQTLFDGRGLVAGETDWQCRAAELALRKRLVIVSGGPGTGKTTTVVKLLAALFHTRNGEELRPALAAPTGKAAMRLMESVAATRETLLERVPEAAQIPAEAMTLHRLLGAGGNGSFRHDRRNPLRCNVVVVDEASMVDLAMMSRLVEALPAGARLILLGDKDQLASVESGAVLADLLASLPQCSVVLQRSWRFDDNIRDMALAVNAGEMEQAWQLLEERPNLHLLQGEWLAQLARRSEPYLAEAQRAGGKEHGCSEEQAAQVFAKFRSFQVLCALRNGSRGVEQVNHAIQRLLAGAGFHCPDGEWFAGRPLMVTANDYGLGLFNGDIGICLPGPQGEEGRVWFEGGQGFKILSLSRIPRHETVFAMTIHKSQGSEFDSVAVVLPAEGNRLLSRELVYTAMTRAKSEVLMATEKAVLAEALAPSRRRGSGLRALLQSAQEKK